MLNWIPRKSNPKRPVAADEGDASARVASARVASDAVEKVLLQGVRQGRQKAFDELYRLYHPRLQRFLRHLLRQADQEIEEILNDTMIVVWKRPDSFDGRSRLSTWIFGIAYRKALKALSRQAPPAEQADPTDTPDPAPGPEWSVAHLQLRGRLQQAVGELSVDHRAVIDLCYLQDMSHGEIAQIVGCPSETVKTRLFYARRRLRTLLEDLAAHLPGEAQ